MCTVYDEQYRLALFAACKICVCNWLLHYSHAYHANFCADYVLALSSSVIMSPCLFLCVFFITVCIVCICVLVCAYLCYISVSCFLNWLSHGEIKFIYTYLSLHCVAYSPCVRRVNNLFLLLQECDCCW